MGEAKLRKHLRKEINMEVHFSSGINILVPVVIKGITVVGNQGNSLESLSPRKFCVVFVTFVMFGSKNAPIHKNLWAVEQNRCIIL